jgi:hypothetical protein
VRFRFQDLGTGTDQVTSMNQGYHREDFLVSAAGVSRSVLDHTSVPQSHRHDGDTLVRTGSSTEDFRLTDASGCFHHNLHAVDGFVTTDTSGC